MEAIVISVFVVAIIAGAHCGCHVPQKEFDAEKFMGDWWIVSYFVPEGAEPPMNCLQMALVMKEKHKYHANVTGKLVSNGVFYSDDGAMELDNPEHPARINILWREILYSFTVVETDYTNYGAVTGCVVEKGHEVAEYTGIFSRTSTIDAANLEKMKAALTRVNVDVSRLISSDNTKC